MSGERVACDAGPEAWPQTPNSIACEDKLPLTTPSEPLIVGVGSRSGLAGCLRRSDRCCLCPCAAGTLSCGGCDTLVLLRLPASGGVIAPHAMLPLAGLVVLPSALVGTLAIVLGTGCVATASLA